MQTSIFPRVAAARAQSPVPAAALLSLLRSALRSWRIRRASARLEGLDDRMLSDIGIGRADIERVVRYGRAPERGWP